MSILEKMCENCIHFCECDNTGFYEECSSQGKPYFEEDETLAINWLVVLFNKKFNGSAFANAENPFWHSIFEKYGADDMLFICEYLGAENNADFYLFDGNTLRAYQDDDIQRMSDDMISILWSKANNNILCIADIADCIALFTDKPDIDKKNFSCKSKNEFSNLFYGIDFTTLCNIFNACFDDIHIANAEKFPYWFHNFNGADECEYFVFDKSAEIGKRFICFNEIKDFREYLEARLSE